MVTLSFFRAQLKDVSGCTHQCFISYPYINFHRAGEGLLRTSALMSPKRSQGTHMPDSEEETPLLRDRNAPRTETPLPITQVVVLVLLQLCEPIASQSIKPYINKVRSLIPLTYVVNNVCLSLSVSSQSLVVTKKKSDTTQG